MRVRLFKNWKKKKDFCESAPYTGLVIAHARTFIHLLINESTKMSSRLSKDTFLRNDVEVVCRVLAEQSCQSALCKSSLLEYAAEMEYQLDEVEWAEIHKRVHQFEGLNMLKLMRLSDECRAIELVAVKRKENDQLKQLKRTDEEKDARRVVSTRKVGILMMLISVAFLFITAPLDLVLSSTILNALNLLRGVAVCVCLAGFVALDIPC